MRPTVLSLCLLIPYVVISQTGFNTTPDFGYPRDHFRNLIVHDDTIVCYGMARKDTVTYQQCLFLARFDPSGTPIDSKLICDSLGGTLSMAINWSDIVITSDGGYAITAASFDRYDGMFIKLRHDLSVEFVQEYPDSVNLVEFYNSIVELPDGYLLGGHLQRPNFLQDAFLHRVDKQGNSVWFSYYGEYNVFDSFSNYYKVNDSLVIYVGGYIVNENVLAGRGPWIVVVNPDDGQIIHEWRPTNTPLEYLHYISPLPDHSWLLYGKKALQAIPTLARPFWAVIDSAFNVESMKLFGPDMFTTNFFWDFEPTLDNNFIAAGQINADNPNIEPDVYGWLYKVSPTSLDSLWSLKITAPIPNVQQSGNYLGGVGVLSSGNMVAGGYSQSGNDIYCWLVKFTPDGCVDTIWCATSPAWEPVEVEMQEPVKVWPNPASDFLFVEIPGPVESGELSLFAFDGQLVLRQKITKSARIVLSGIPPGIYLCRVADSTGGQFNTKIVISR